MDRQILVEKQTTTEGTNGRPSTVWEPLSYLPGSPQVAERFWAEVQDVMPSRSESIRQGLNVARNQTRLRMRWRNDIDSTMRITLYGDTDVLYQIVGGPAEIEGRKNRIELMLERYSTQGG